MDAAGPCRAKATTGEPEISQATAHFRRWWQVLGSNQRRLSRRFYRRCPLIVNPPRWPGKTNLSLIACAGFIPRISSEPETSSQGQRDTA
jgi:hypothetical protein